MTARHRPIQQPGARKPVWHAASIVAEWIGVGLLFASSWALGLLPRRIRIRVIRAMDDSALRAERDRHDAKYRD